MPIVSATGDDADGSPARQESTKSIRRPLPCPSLLMNFQHKRVSVLLKSTRHNSLRIVLYTRI